MTGDTYHHGDLKNALVQAGMEVLVREGLAGLSLRKVARQAGVSHAAPYAHFSDKQALIAAISTEGFKQLYGRIGEVFSGSKNEPENLVIESAWAYLQFALNEPDRFKVMFSGVLEQEKEYPEFVEASRQNYLQLVEMVKISQQAGALSGKDPEMMAVSLWSTVHGFACLLLEGQISHKVLEKDDLKNLLSAIIRLPGDVKD